MNKEFGKISPLIETVGNIHDYMGMTIDYLEKGTVKFSMFDYLEEILVNLPDEFRGKATTPAGGHLFTVDKDAEKLNDKDADMLHHYVVKLLVIAKQTRSNIATQ